jgi:L-asparaginase II
VTRGGIVESRHTGAWAVADAAGAIIRAAGDIDGPVFPRSAVKAFQCLPVIESGAADAYGFTDEEIALACSSHNGEPEHVRVARAMLAKAGENEAHYECGAHWPLEIEAHHAVVRGGGSALPVHNNCSGKHAGMLALAQKLGADHRGYVKGEHAVQRAIARTMGDICGIDLDRQPVGIDGCSVPTWATPLRNLAAGFARLTGRPAGRRIIAAVRAHPFMVAGTGRFDTALMQAVPRVFAKTGAEGVYCACVPHAGLGIALKSDDGAGRAAEMALAHILASLDCWAADEKARLETFSHRPLENWRKFTVGELRAV